MHEERQDTDKRHLGKSRWRICIRRSKLSRVLKLSCSGGFECLDRSVGKSTCCTKLRIRVQMPTIYIKPGHAVYSCNSSTGDPREREASEVLLLSLILLLLFDFNRANTLYQGNKMDDITGH